MMAMPELLRHVLLVVEMFGLESCASLEAVQMVPNLQALGLPVRLCTTGATASAALGILLIPALGWLMDRKASSPAAKGRILFFTSSLLLMGTALVLSANLTNMASTSSRNYAAPPPSTPSPAHSDGRAYSKSPSDSDSLAHSNRQTHSDSHASHDPEVAAAHHTHDKANLDDLVDPRVDEAVPSVKKDKSSHEPFPRWYGFHENIPLSAKRSDNVFVPEDKHKFYRFKRSLGIVEDSNDVVRNFPDMKYFSDDEGTLFKENILFENKRHNGRQKSESTITNDLMNKMASGSLNDKVISKYNNQKIGHQIVGNLTLKQTYANPHHEKSKGGDHDNGDHDNADTDKGNHGEGRRSESAPWFAWLAMLGYALIDCGFDSSNCFLKTFVLACAPPHHHAGLILKIVLFSSLGGSLYCVLGLAAPGRRLAEQLLEHGTFDPHSADTALLALICLVLTLTCLLTTLLTGRAEARDRARLGSYEQIGEAALLPRERRVSLGRYPESDFEHIFAHEFGRSSPRLTRYTGLALDAEGSGTTWLHEAAKSLDLKAHQQFFEAEESQRRRSRSLNSASSGRSAAAVLPVRAHADSVDSDGTLGADEQGGMEVLAPAVTAGRGPSLVATPQPSRRSSLAEFARRQKKQILINVSQFFLIGALYSFEIYCTNFVSIVIEGGDPRAPPGTAAHQAFLRGVEWGTAGVLAYYLSFTAATFLLQYVLPSLGALRSMRLAMLGQILLCLCLAAAPSLWLYFTASVWMGGFRAVINTVPFILTNQLALAAATHGGRPDSGFSIAVVSSMLPLAFTLCSAVMGPLMAATTAAAPVWYAGVSGLLGLLTFAFYADE